MHAEVRIDDTVFMLAIRRRLNPRTGVVPRCALGLRVPLSSAPPATYPSNYRLQRMRGRA
jgi:hypothetical protein